MHGANRDRLNYLGIVTVITSILTLVLKFTGFSHDILNVIALASAVTLGFFAIQVARAPGKNQTEE